MSESKVNLRVLAQSNHGRRWRAGAAIVALLLSGGCTEPETNVAPPDSPPPSITSELEAAAGASTIDLQLVNRAELDALIATHRGKAVFVDFWATWCAPCIAQLPHTAKLAQEGKARGLAVITVCMDDPENAASAEKVLADKGATDAINLISRDGGGSRAMEAFAIEGGALPYYQLYDVTGQLSTTFGLDPAAREQFTADDIDAAVDELLAP